MATASSPTLLSLDRFAAIAGINPLHFNGVVDDDIPMGITCGDPFVQYSWQNSDKTGRDEIAQTIADVETLVQDYLNFSPAPRFYVNWPVQYPRPSRPDIFATGVVDLNGFVRAIPLGVGYIISGGREVRSPLGLNATVVYTDADADGYKETATVTVSNIDAQGNILVAPSDSTSNMTIHVYYPGTGADDAWEIRPLQKVSISVGGGTTTIVFRREQAIIPGLLTGYSARGVTGTVDANFLSTVDVYHIYLDPGQAQAELRWDEAPCAQPLGVIEMATQAAWMSVRDRRLGWAAIQPAHWVAASGGNLGYATADCLSLGRAPDDIRAWFKAGWPSDGKGNMDAQWERAISYYVLSRLDRKLCDCDSLRTFTQYWADDFAQSVTGASQQIARKRLENPFGTTRAAIHLWEQIQRNRNPDS